MEAENQKIDRYKLLFQKKENYEKKQEMLRKKKEAEVKNFA